MEASIEQSLEQGKWFIITNNTDKHLVQKVVENFVAAWKQLEAYQDHLDDNESFQRGLRYSYRAHKNDSELAQHERKLIECTDKFDSGDDSNASSLTSTSSKKRRNDTAFDRGHISQFENSWDASRLSWTMRASKGTDHSAKHSGSVNSFTTTAEDFNRFMKEQNEKLDSKLENDRVKQSKLNKDLQEAIKNQSIQMGKLSDNLDAKCDNIDMKLLNIEMKQDRFQAEMRETMAQQVERVITQVLRQQGAFGVDMIHSPIQRNQEFSMEESIDNQLTPQATGPRTLFHRQEVNGGNNNRTDDDTENISMALDNSINITMNEEAVGNATTIGGHRSDGDPQCG